MSLKQNVFTLREIAVHLLNQAIMADTDFQLNQQSAWQQMNKRDERYSGFAKMSNLFLNEMDFSFELMPVPLSLWEKVKLFFGGRLKSKRGTFYAIAAASAPAEGILKVKISIKREGQGKYDSAIATTPETQLKPEEINVVGFIK